MRNFAAEAGTDDPSRFDSRVEEKRGRPERRCVAPVPRGPGITISKGDKQTEEELLETTVVVSSNPPQLNPNELYTPSNIQLREEVFVHYPASAPNSPGSTAVEAHKSGALQWQTVASGDNAHGRVPIPQPSGCCSPRCTPSPQPRGPIQHEQDHDCCPFTAIRRSEWTLRNIANVRRTSPFDWTNLLSSFSVKNAFMFYPPPPTYGFFRDEDGAIQVRSQTGKRAPRLDHERIEYVRRMRRMSRKVPDDLVAGALHGIASAARPSHDGGAGHGGGDGGGGGSEEDDDSEPSFKLIFIPWENEVQSYFIRSGAVVFGRRVRMGRLPYTLAWPCAIPCSIIRPHRRMSSHVAIFFHCNGEDIGRPSCLRLLTLANALHMTILVPEYPGYGLFEGTPSEASIKGAMERVIEFLFASDPSFTPSRLILIGHSIGTGVAIHVAKFIKRIFLHLHDSPDLSQQVPYACPMSTGQPIPTEYAAAVRCPPNSFVLPFSAVPAASPTAQIPPPLPEKVRPLPVFTPPTAPLTSRAALSGNEDDSQRLTGAEGNDVECDLHSRHDRTTPMHAPYGRSAPTRKHGGPKPTPVILCPHYALGGVILLAPFASVRCVEKWSMLRHHGFDVRELERRRLSIPEDVLVPAPADWAEDAHHLRETGEAPPNMDFLRPSPVLFDLARYVSLDRFPTVDVVRELQEEVGFFTHTPLLLLHGAQDVLIPAINSVAIASSVRQATGGRSAKVYLGFLRNEGHNNLHCSHLTRRFYKDVILLPHLQAQRDLRKELEETLRNGLGQSTAASQSEGNALMAAKRVDSASSSGQTTAPPPPPPSATPGRREEAPHAFGAFCASTPPPPPPPRSSLSRSPTSATNRTTEPIDEEQREQSTPLSPTQETCHGKTAAGSTAGAAAPSAARQPPEPCLYFIEPAYTEEGATWLENGNFTGPVRIRLLRPPPQRGLLTEPPPVAKEESRDANVFVTRAADPTTSVAHRQHHRGGHDYDHSNSDPSLPLDQPPNCGPGQQRRRRHSAAVPGEGQACCISQEFEESLRDTIHRTQPPNVNFAPAATMLHIALFHNLDHYDVGSIAVASVTKNSVDATIALRQWQRFRRNHFILRCCIALFYFVSGAFFLSVAICHGVLTHPSKLRPYLPAGTPTQRFHLDARVVIWGVLDGFAYLLLGVVRFFHPRLGLGNLSRYMNTPSSVLAVYATARLVAYALCTGAGILMAMIIALTPPDRGGVDWDRWSDLPYSRRVWISYLPRWTMVTSASIHMCFIIAIFLKNH